MTALPGERMLRSGAAATGESPPQFPLAGALSGSLLARIAGAAAAFGLHALLARLAGAEQYGTYSYVLACLGVAVTVAGLGLDMCLVRFVSVYRARSAWPYLKGLLGWSERWVLAAAGLTTGLAALFLALAGQHLDASLARTGWIACGVLPVAALLRLNEARLLGLKRVALAQLPDGVLRPVVTAGLAALAFGLSGRPLTSPAAMGLHLWAMAAAAAIGLALGRRATPPMPRGVQARYDIGAWMQVSLPLWMEAGLRLLAGSLDVILVGALVGMAEAGIYAVASRLAELVVFGAHASQMAARPHIAESDARTDRPATQRAVSEAAGWATLFAVATCGVLIPAHSLVLRLFGPEFAGGARVLLILTAGYFVTACTALVDSVMVMTGHQRAGARITAAVLALKLPLMVFAITRWGIAGAALASAATMIFGRLWGWTYVRRNLDLDGTVLGWWRRRRPW